MNMCLGLGMGVVVGVHSNHVTSSKQADTFICHTSMCRHSIKATFSVRCMICFNFSY